VPCVCLLCVSVYASEVGISLRLRVFFFTSGVVCASVEHEDRAVGGLQKFSKVSALVYHQVIINIYIYMYVYACTYLHTYHLDSTFENTS
jgi:hypothetical protein